MAGRYEGVAGHIPLEWVGPYKEGPRERPFPDNRLLSVTSKKLALSHFVL